MSQSVCSSWGGWPDRKRAPLSYMTHCHPERPTRSLSALPHTAWRFPQCWMTQKDSESYLSGWKHQQVCCRPAESQRCSVRRDQRGLSWSDKWCRNWTRKWNFCLDVMIHICWYKNKPNVTCSSGALLCKDTIRTFLWKNEKLTLSQHFWKDYITRRQLESLRQQLKKKFSFSLKILPWKNVKNRAQAQNSENSSLKHALLKNVEAL